MGLLVPVAVAQKPPAPPAPPSTTPSRPTTPAPSSSPPGQPEMDLVMFLMGRVATDDGTAVPNDVLVERICNASVRQQVHATFGGSINVGAIVVQRTTKIEGMTLSATPYKAPRDARRAYEKGLEAERNGKLTNARKYFEQAVEIYPKFANAWFQLGTVLQKEKQNDAARKAYIQATTIDTKFLPPYLSLALMAYKARNWTEVLKLTGHILDLDPLNQAAATGHILDLDPLNYAEAYFYNSVANYKLNKIEDAEKSALKAEHLDLRTRIPQLHLLLAEIYSRKNNYANAISELQTYLELAPHAKQADQVREQLAELEKLNGSVSTSEKPEKE